MTNHKRSHRENQINFSKEKRLLYFELPDPAERDPNLRIETYLSRMLKDTGQEHIEAVWAEVRKDREIDGYKEVQDFAEAVYKDLMTTYSSARPEIKENIRKHLPVTPEEVKNLAVKAELISERGLTVWEMMKEMNENRQEVEVNKSSWKWERVVEKKEKPTGPARNMHDETGAEVGRKLEAKKQREAARSASESLQGNMAEVKAEDEASRKFREENRVIDSQHLHNYDELVNNPKGPNETSPSQKRAHEGRLGDELLEKLRKDKNGLDYFDRRYKNIEGYDVFKKNLDSFERREMLWSYDALKSLERLEGELERRLENQELNKAFQREIVSEQRKGGIGAIERRTIKAPQGGFKLDDVISITYISPKGEFREFAYKPRCAIKEGYNDVYGGGSNYAQEEMADVGIIPVPIYFENSDKSTRENRKVKEVELYFRYPGKITYYDHNSKKTVVNIKKHTEYIIEGNNEVRDRHSYVTNEEEDMPRDADYEYAREKATRLNAVLWGTRGQLMKLSNLYKKEGHTWVAGRLEYLSKSLVPYYPSPAAAERRNGWHIALRSIEGGSREDTFFSPTDAFNELAQMYGINERLRTVSHDTTRQVGDVRHLERYYIVPEDPKEVIRKISALVTEMSDSRE